MAKQPLTERELEQRFEDMLDDVYGAVSIAGLEYSTSHALKEVDPTAYRCGFNDWLDGECRDGILFEGDDGEYYDEDPNEENEDEDHEP